MRHAGQTVRTTIALTALAAMAMSMPASQASTANATGPSPLGQELTISGARTGSAGFTLHQDSPVALGAGDAASEQISIRGSGRAIGVVLNRIDRGPSASLAAFLANSCFTPACTPDPNRQIPLQLVTGSPATARGTGEQVVLPAGRYRLTLVTDGAPVQARLRLRGLAKPLHVRPTEPARATIRAIPVQTVTRPAHFVASGGSSYMFSSPAYLLTQTASHTAAGGQQVEGDCLILGQAPPRHIYGPGCPTASPTDQRLSPVLSQGSAPGDLKQRQLGSVSLAGLVPAGQMVSAGSWAISAVPLTRSDTVQMAVELPR